MGGCQASPVQEGCVDEVLWSRSEADLLLGAVLLDDEIWVSVAGEPNEEGFNQDSRIFPLPLDGRTLDEPPISTLDFYSLSVSLDRQTLFAYRGYYDLYWTIGLPRELPPERRWLPRDPALDVEAWDEGFAINPAGSGAIFTVPYGIVDVRDLAVVTTDAYNLLNMAWDGSAFRVSEYPAHGTNDYTVSVNGDVNLLENYPYNERRDVDFAAGPGFGLVYEDWTQEVPVMVVETEAFEISEAELSFPYVDEFGLVYATPGGMRAYDGQVFQEANVAGQVFARLSSEELLAVTEAGIERICLE